MAIADTSLPDIVVASSNARTRARAAQALERGGFPSTVVSTPEEAARLLSRRLSLAIVSVEGDKSSWFELAASLRRPVVRPRVIITSSSTDGRDVVRAINAGASRWLDEPLDEEALLEATRLLLGQPSELEMQVDAAIARAGLTHAETRIARLLLRGATSAEVGEALGNSEKTIRHHITRIYAKCGVETRTEFCNSMVPF